MSFILKPVVLRYIHCTFAPRRTCKVWDTISISTVTHTSEWLRTRYRQHETTCKAVSHTRVASFDKALLCICDMLTNSKINFTACLTTEWHQALVVEMLFQTLTGRYNIAVGPLCSVASYRKHLFGNIAQAWLICCIFKFTHAGSLTVLVALSQRDVTPNLKPRFSSIPEGSCHSQ